MRAESIRPAGPLATAAGLVGAVAMVGGAQALAWLRQDREVVDRAQPMLLALAPGLLPCLWFDALRLASARAAGDARE